MILGDYRLFSRAIASPRSISSYLRKRLEIASAWRVRKRLRGAGLRELGRKIGRIQLREGVDDGRPSVAPIAT